MLEMHFNRKLQMQKLQFSLLGKAYLNKLEKAQSFDWFSLV